MSALTRHTPLWRWLPGVARRRFSASAAAEGHAASLPHSVPPIEPTAAQLAAWTTRALRDGPERARVVTETNKEDIFRLARAEEGLGPAARKLMAAVGWVDYTQRRGNHGLRILTLDGGGTKALSTIDILKRLEQGAQKPVHECFDLIGGTRWVRVRHVRARAHARGCWCCR